MTEADDLRLLFEQLRERLNHLDQRRERLLKILCENERRLETAQSNLIDLARLLDAEQGEQTNE